MKLTLPALIEKIVRAKVKLENAKRAHRNDCPVEADMEGFAPCNCGASSVNTKIDAAIEELTLE